MLNSSLTNLNKAISDFDKHQFHCGYRNKTNNSFLNNKLVLSKKFEDMFFKNYSKDPKNYVKVKLYSSYLGCIEIPVLETPEEGVYQLEYKTDDNVLIKILNAETLMNTFGSVGIPEMKYLKKMESASINIKDNEDTFKKIEKLNGHKKNDMFKHDSHMIRIFDEELGKLYAKNLCVDIYFITIMYLMFLNEKFNIKNITNDEQLISIYNIPGLDNAFFTGSYMVYGNGDEIFYPMGTPDVISHELTHGLIKTLCGLEYEGEAGALNESFADIFATAFEYWLYENVKDLSGTFNWSIGTDIWKTSGNTENKNIKYIRNMENPEFGYMKQPSRYKGTHWVDPSNLDYDNGGVHTNSGPSNRCFYLITKIIGMDESIQLYYNCLRGVSKNCSYEEYKNKLIGCCKAEYSDAVNKSLFEIGL